MSFLNPAEDWENLQRSNPLLAARIAIMPRSFFVPPPGIDPVMAYVRVFAACLAAYGHVIPLCLLLGMCGQP